MSRGLILFVEYTGRRTLNDNSCLHKVIPSSHHHEWKLELRTVTVYTDILMYLEYTTHGGSALPVVVIPVLSQNWLWGKYMLFSLNSEWKRTLPALKGTPVSSINKTDRHDITEILLKVVLNTIAITRSFSFTCGLHTVLIVPRVKGVSDSCLTLTQQFFSYIMARTS
jgi:hypothetical protein